MKSFFRTAVGKAILAVPAALFILFLRRPDAFLNPQFWAEDFVFLIAAERQGFAALWVPQAGYLQLIPRVVSWLGSPLDPGMQPAFYILAWVAIALMAVFTCLSKRHHLPSKTWLAAAVLIVPHSGEVFLNLTNAQWLAALAILLTTLKDDPVTRRDWAADITILVIGGLSGPFIIVAVLLFAFRWWKRRTARSGALLAVSSFLAAVQTWFVVHSPSDHEFVGPFSGLNLIANICFRLPCNLFFGSLMTPEMGRPLAIVLGVAVFAFLIVAVYRAGNLRVPLCCLIAYIVCLMIASMVRKRIDIWTFGNSLVGDRYFFIPKVVLLWVVGAIFASQPSRWIKWTAFGLLACGIFCNASHFRFSPYIDYHWYNKCQDIRKGRQVQFTINPGWKFKYRRNIGPDEGPYW